MVVKNFLRPIPRATNQEIFEPVWRAKGLTVERIVSRGQATPPGTWLSEKKDEWVMVLTGRARLRFYGRRKFVEMKAGDYLLIPSGKRHRVEWTDKKKPTVWLAIYY